MTPIRALMPLVVVLAAFSSGCRHSSRRTMQRVAAEDFNCSPRLIRVTPYGDSSAGQFVVQGCGRRAVYSKTPDGPMLSSSIESDELMSGPPRGPMPPQPVGPPPPPPAPPPPAPEE